jgi:transcriptional regulator with XRE-family HTH domain
MLNVMNTEAAIRKRAVDALASLDAASEDCGMVLDALVKATRERGGAARLAGAMGVTAQYLSDILKGRRRLSAPVLERLAKLK